MSLKLSSYLITLPEDVNGLGPADKLLLFSTRSARLIRISVFVYQLLGNGDFDKLPDPLFIKLVENEIIISEAEIEFDYIIAKHIAIAADLKVSPTRQGNQATPNEKEHFPRLCYEYDRYGKKILFSMDHQQLLQEKSPGCCVCIRFPVCGSKVPKLAETDADCPIHIQEIRNLMADVLSPFI
jgi:hypothetical protein